MLELGGQHSFLKDFGMDHSVRRRFFEGPECRALRGLSFCAAPVLGEAASQTRFRLRGRREHNNNNNNDSDGY